MVVVRGEIIDLPKTRTSVLAIQGTEENRIGAYTCDQIVMCRRARSLHGTGQDILSKAGGGHFERLCIVIKRVQCSLQYNFHFFVSTFAPIAKKRFLSSGLHCISKWYVYAHYVPHEPLLHGESCPSVLASARAYVCCVYVRIRTYIAGPFFFQTILHRCQKRSSQQLAG